MVFESLHCRPFGPFRDRILDLAPGMNVIHGPNESGKSTLRAALSVGLCGQRRGPGRPKAAKQFAVRHRPWDDRSKWAVGVVIHLADGRRVELRQDLARGVDSSARDAESHLDLSTDIIKDGAPDGSSWLGLNRRTFDSVACVRQAEILAILEDPGALQEDLQRAAATARADHTARAAVERLSEFHRERVGTDRSWTKPLRKSQQAVDTAEGALQAAREKHGEHLSKLEKMRIDESEERRVQTRLQTVRAILAEAEAEAARERYNEVLEWSLLFPQGQPLPPGHGEEDDLEEGLIAVLSDWESAPEPRRPEGPDVAELKSLIAESETWEAACRAVVMENEMTEMKERYDEATELSASFPDGEPQAPDGADGDLGQAVAVALDAWCSLPVLRPPDGPTVDEIEVRIEESKEKERAHAAARAEVEASEFGRILNEIRHLHDAVRGGPEYRPDEREEIEREVVEALRRWDERPEINPPTGQTEAELAGELASIDQEEIRLEERNEVVEVLRQSPVLHGAVSLGAIAFVTASALTGSIVGWVTSSVLIAAGTWWFRQNLVGQKARRQKRREDLSARRRHLERAIDLRRMDDQARQQARQQVERAEQRVAAAAAGLGSASATTREQVEFLREWLAARGRGREAFDAHRNERMRLEQMSRGRSPADLEAEAKALDRTASEAAEGVDPGQLAAARRAPLPVSEWERLRQTAADERMEWSAEREQRRAADAAYEARLAKRDETVKHLLEVATMAHVESDTPEDARSGLESWQSRRKERQQEFAQRTRDWARLQGLLEDRTLVEFSDQVNERQRDYSRFAGGIPQERLVDARNEDLTPARWELLQEQEERRRNEWNATLGKREAREETYTREAARRNRLAEAVIEAANSVDSETNAPAAAAEKIREWLARRREERERYEERREQWGRYQQMLDGSTPADLEQRARELEDEAEPLSASVDADFAAKLRSEEPAALEDRRDRIQEELERLRRRLDTARGESEQIEKTLPCLVELEESLAVAKSWRDRVRRLDETLGITIRLLQQAEERIHRDLAPVLRRGVQQRLASVTGGRYTDCRVNPQTLAVEVCGDEGRWRSAVNLSRGTAEQIYLLLRVTLAEHLGNPGEPCPLILDDPTASSDTDRRDAVLNTLLEIAAKRQVIVFTHDPGVRDWAERHLAGNPRHRIEPLSTDEIPA